MGRRVGAWRGGGEARATRSKARPSKRDVVDQMDDAVLRSMSPEDPADVPFSLVIVMVPDHRATR